jgi:hypothetical protein
MPKVKMAAILIMLIISSFASADSKNVSEGIRTFGTAQIPSSIRIIKNGIEKTYTPTFAEQQFIMYDDTSFSMGANTRCDPYLGQTADTIQIPLLVTKRIKFSTEYEPGTYDRKVIDVGPTGAAILVVSKGSKAYGRCKNGTLDLTAITFQAADPTTGKNNYNTPFNLVWEAAK